ncbi:MAG: hypothetical protein ABIB43_01940 [archaeon]
MVGKLALYTAIVAGIGLTVFDLVEYKKAEAEIVKPALVVEYDYNKRLIGHLEQEPPTFLWYGQDEEIPVEKIDQAKELRERNKEIKSIDGFFESNDLYKDQLKEARGETKTLFPGVILTVGGMLGLAYNSLKDNKYEIKREDLEIKDSQ